MLRYVSALLTLTCLVGNVYAQGNSSTTATPFACGAAGYFQCQADLGGGCCPVGLICAEGQACMLPVTDSSQSTTAPFSECAGRNGYHSCPQSQGGDCCPNFYMCATATDAPCRLTLKLGLVTETGAITAGTAVSFWTTTRVIDPPSSTVADRVPELVSSSAGLTTQQIGGIVGGSLGAALTIVAGIVLLIRRRKQQLAADYSESPFQKGELDGEGWQRAELQDKTSGYKTSELDAEVSQVFELPDHMVPVELAGGNSHHELVGGYEAHGTSELHGSTPLSKDQRS